MESSNIPNVQNIRAWPFVKDHQRTEQHALRNAWDRLYSVGDAHFDELGSVIGSILVDYSQQNVDCIFVVDSIYHSFAAHHTASVPVPAAYFAQRAKEISGVVGVYSKISEDQVVHLWTVVRDDDYSIRDRVYSVEEKMYALYPNKKFDFFVVTLEKLANRNLKQVIPSGFIKQ